MKSSPQFILQKNNVLAAIPLALLFCIYALHIAVPVAFYFDAPFFLHRQWFPRFYVASFIFLQSLIPVLTALWSVLFIRQLGNSPISAAAKSACFVTVAGTCHLFFHFWGFKHAIQFVFFLSILTILPAIFKRYRGGANSIWLWIKKRKLVTTTGFFIGYILLCMLAPDNFHPFYRFSMYSKHDSTKRVFTLIGPGNQLLPMEEYFYLTENAVGILYNDAAGYSRSAPLIADSVAAPKLWNRMLTFKKKKIPFDSVSIHKTNLYLKAGKIFADEQVLYTTKVE